MKQFSKIFSLLFLALFLGLTLCGCSVFHKNETGDEKTIILTKAQEEHAKIEVAPAKEMELEIEITIPAQFKAQNHSIDNIYSPIDGKVTGVFVEPGAVVKKGQKLAQIHSDEIGQIQLEFLEKILEVDAQSAEMSAQLDLAREAFKREEILYQEKISSRAEYEMANAEFKKAAANLNALKAKRSALTQVYSQRLSIYGSSASINTVLSTKKVYPYVTLSANKSGILLERHVNPGEIVEKNRELFNIADLSTIWLVGYAFEKDSSLLKVGEKIKGTIEEWEGKTISGELSYVSHMLDNTTKTLEVRANIPNSDLKIKPNMYAEMFVHTGTANVLAVPNSAVVKYGDYNFVYVKTGERNKNEVFDSRTSETKGRSPYAMVKNNTYEERKVEIGRKNDDYCEILSGVKEGEIVVTQGAFSLLGEIIKLQEKQ